VSDDSPVKTSKHTRESGICHFSISRVCKFLSKEMEFKLAASRSGTARVHSDQEKSARRLDAAVAGSLLRFGRWDSRSHPD